MVYKWLHHWGSGKSLPAETHIRITEEGAYPSRVSGPMSVRTIPDRYVMDHCFFAKEAESDCPYKSNPDTDCFSCPFHPENKPKRVKVLSGASVN